ncbi:MAG: GNAT family N-acetyltransferase [Bacillaceae bacterium]
MIDVRKATLQDVQGIINVCSEGYRVTYPHLLPQNHIEEIIEKFYNVERITNEVIHTDQNWNGWFVAIDSETVVGAGGGGFTDEHVAELFVLYLDPARKREGIGTKLLAVITADQIMRGAKEQWVSVAQNNDMGIPFYEAVGFHYQSERPSYGVPEEEGFLSLRYKRTLL